MSKKIRLHFDHQFRWNQLNLQQRSSFLQAGVRYKFSKHFNAKLQYRYNIRNNQRNTRRITADFGTKWKIKPMDGLTFKYRGRFQNAIVTYTGQNITHLRNKASLEYLIAKKWETTVSYENFFRMNERNEIRAHRYRWALNYQLSKRVAIDLFYQYEQEVNKKLPENAQTVGLLLQWKLNKNKSI